MIQDHAEVRLRDQEQLVGLKAKPFGAHLDLADAFFAGDVQYFADCLCHQRGYLHEQRRVVYDQVIGDEVGLLLNADVVDHLFANRFNADNLVPIDIPIR